MNKLFTLILAASIAVGGFFLWTKFQDPTAKQTRKPAIKAARMAVEVNVVKLEKEKIQLFKTLPARISARKITEVKPQVSGIIKKRLFTEGQKVEEKQELYEIDQTLFQIALNSAQTNFQSAKDNLKRLESLVKTEAVSKKQHEDAKTEFARAQAELEKAQTNLTYTKVLAPISGYISKSNITEGNLVNANQAEALATIALLDPIFADITLPSKNFSEFKNKAIAVTLLVDGKKFEETGVLKFSEVFANPNTDSVKLRAEFPNKDETLLPGMFVSAKLHLEPFEAIKVPQRATNRNPDGSLSVVIIDKNNIAHIRTIVSSGIIDNSWIVKSGIEDGETLVTEGYQKVREGSKVKPILQN